MSCKKIAFVLTALLTTVLALPAQAQSARLTDFPVTLNGIELWAMENNTQYPLLVYNDITYFPMTWYNCRMLGLETQWSEKTGLAIKQNNALTSSIGYYPQEKSNPQTVQVSVPDFKVSVNGQAIDNSKEQYPLLNFRDVTYFPLTWRFAHDAFGWDYAYTEAQGLTITSSNPQVIYFPALEGRSAHTPIRLLDNGCYYYLHDTHNGAGIEICRAPVDNSFRMQKLYTFAQMPYQVDFALLDNKPYVLYQMQAGEALQSLVLSGESAQAVDLDLSRFTNGSSMGAEQDGWHYAIRQGQLSRSRSDSDWQVCADQSANWFGLLEGQVYYTHQNADGSQALYQVKERADDQLLMKDNVRQATIQNGYLLCLLAPEEDYGAKVFDGKGQLVLAITDPVDRISISDGVVLAVTNASEAQDFLKVIRL